MAITKILPRNSRLDVAIKYVLNGDKTEQQVLTARINCDPGWEYRQMMDTNTGNSALSPTDCAGNTACPS